ncbi:lipoate-protein ligase B [secondary endosymbiont of Heteropsylla cubana]|uniref:Octanoyltransferase n=1 Tax=secondary endosymbiont of Heteropsylla cubana TaxID=134287 RepID=J3VUE5_9ENTR|nr:lipoyl(octanoyl) transferase LipB [secondary endosymbiont of Heteropsylla cubana]AFP85761.1 lipoate-protein ligase B [secondary endosymbiont of Heteropsylla cubana]
MLEHLIVRQLGLQPYERVFLAMHRFNDKRNAIIPDEVWLVQHPNVFTLGHAGKIEHILDPGDIPVIQSDRGGQVTFHSPGQQIMYVLVNLRRRQLSGRNLIKLLEHTIVNTLSHFSIIADTLTDAPGVYVETKKICSLGLRILKGCSLHGLALNVAMDLLPFLRINPCGYPGLQMTQVSDIVPGTGIDDVLPVLLKEYLQLMKVSVSEIYHWDPNHYN